jgi:divalent metal cation (Fe/Co/Zn/Cd) transporter
LTLKQAHDQASQLEAALYEELPHIQTVNTHIEPRQAPALASSLDAVKETPETLKARIMALVEGDAELCDCHDLRLWPGQHGYHVMLHCLADPDLPIVEAHHLADRVEERIKNQIPQVYQVLVHVEPE